VHFMPESGLAEAFAAVCKVVPRASDGMLTFGEKEFHVLTEETYGDFLAQGKEGPAGGTAFRVQLQLQVEGGAVDTPPSPGRSRRHCSGAVRRAQRREARAARAAAVPHMLEEDPRDLDQLISALDGEAPPPVLLQKGVRKQGKTTKAKKGSDSKMLPNLCGDAKPVMPMLCSLQNIHADGHQEGAVHDDDQGKADGVMRPAGACPAYRARVSPTRMQAATWHHAMPSPSHVDKASDCATESTCGDIGEDATHEEVTQGAGSELCDMPGELWPPTPESTPPSSPRCYHNQPQPVYWMPVPVWIPTM